MTSLPHRPEHVTAARAYGLEPARGAPCPRALAGKRCQRSKGTCICVEWPLLDHAQRWTRNGHPLLIGEPYSFIPQELAEFSTALDELGLTAVVTGRSPWNPGETVAVEIRRQTDDWS